MVRDRRTERNGFVVQRKCRNRVYPVGVATLSNLCILLNSRAGQAGGPDICMKERFLVGHGDQSRALAVLQAPLHALVRAGVKVILRSSRKQPELER